MHSVSFIATSRNPDLYQQDPSFIYRCDNLARALASHGLDTQTLHITQLNRRNAGRYVVFHRPAASPRLLWTIWQLRRRGCRLIADFDDLIFDPHYAAYSPAVLNDTLPLHKVVRACNKYRKSLDLFDIIIVSTRPLMEHLRQLLPEKRIVVIPNAIHHSWLGKTEHRSTNFDSKTITYFPGTRSHDRDFDTIAATLERFLDKYPDTRLQITGLLNRTIRARNGQVTHTPRVPFADYSNHLKNGWVNLAPLESTPFNACKSANKVMEAGYWGVPTICSENSDILRFTTSGALPASSDTEWFETLEELRSRHHYQEKTDNLCHRVLSNNHPDKVAIEFTRIVAVN